MAVHPNQLGSHQVCLAGLASPFACLSLLYCALPWVVVFSSSHHILQAGKTYFCTRAQVCSQLVSQHSCTPQPFVQDNGGILKVQAVYISSRCVSVAQSLEAFRSAVDCMSAQADIEGQSPYLICNATANCISVAHIYIEHQASSSCAF